MARNKLIFNTLEEIDEHKEELLLRIEKSNEEIGTLWHGLFSEKKDNSKGELVASIVNKGIIAFDAFILVRKLMKQYGNIFGKKKKK